MASIRPAGTAGDLIVLHVAKPMTELQRSIDLEFEHRINLFPSKLPERHRFRSAQHLKLEWSLIFAIRVKSNAIDIIRETQRRMRFPPPTSQS